MYYPMWSVSDAKRYAPLMALAATFLSLAIAFGVYNVTARLSGHANFVAPQARPQLAIEPRIPNTGGSVSAAAASTTEPPAINKGAMVSFDLDDGYESAYLHALPLFQKAGMKVTFDIVPEYLGRLGYVNQAQMTYVQKHGEDVENLKDRVDAAAVKVEVGSKTSFEDIKRSIDDAVKRNLWIRISFHRIDEQLTHDGKNASHELVEEVIQYVAVQGIQVVTDRQAAALSSENK